MVVLAGAFAAPVPAVRTEVVRALNAIGGTLAQEIIGRALQDPDEVLRAAAQEGLTPPPPALPAPAAE